MATKSGRVLIYGGKGALGSTVVKYFKEKNFWVGNIDLAANEEANANVIVKMTDSWIEQEKQVMTDVTEMMGSDKADGIFCVAGGWAGGNAQSPDFVRNADMMWKQSVWTSFLAAHIAAKCLTDGGLLSLPGAQPALEGTPGMIGYGAAKAAVHQLTKSLAKEGSGLPKSALVIATLPVTLDTPMNRKFMSGGDFSTWTPLEYVADMFHGWLTEADKRPANGSLVQIVTKAGQTELIMS